MSWKRLAGARRPQSEEKRKNTMFINEITVSFKQKKPQSVFSIFRLFTYLLFFHFLCGFAFVLSTQCNYVRFTWHLSCLHLFNICFLCWFSQPHTPPYCPSLSPNELNLRGKKACLGEQTQGETWKRVLCGGLYFLKGRGVSVPSRRRALVSAVPNWPLVSCFLMWVIQFVCLPVTTSLQSPCQRRAALSAFPNKMPSAGPNFSRQVPSISGWRPPRSHSTKQHRLLKRAKGFIFFLFPLFFLSASLFLTRLPCYLSFFTKNKQAARVIK